MSDYAAHRYDEKEDFQVLLSKRDCGESSYHKHSQWMAHWRRASSSADPQNGKSCSPFEEINNGNYAKDCGTLPSEIMKTRVAERLMVGMSHGSASAGNAQQFGSNVWNAACGIYHAVECKDGEQGDEFFESSMMQEDVNLFTAKAVVSNKFPVWKLTDSSLNREKISELLSSDNLSSEWSHFPMFEINQKIDSILNPKRRSGLGTVSDNLFVPQQSLKLNMSQSSVMAFPSTEYQVRSQRITDETMKHYKYAEAILSHQEGHMALKPDLSGQKLIGHLSNVNSCCCSEAENISSSSQCLVDEHPTSPNLANSKQVPPNWSSRDKVMFSATKSDNKIVESTFWNPKSSTSGGHQEPQDVARGVFFEPVLGREYKIEQVNDSGKHDDENFHGTCRSHGVACASPSLHDVRHHMNTQRMDSAGNLTGSYELPDATENMLTEQTKDEALTHGKQPMPKFTDSSKRKGPCLFEMLTLASKSDGTCSKDSQSAGKSRSDDVRMHGTNIGSHLLGTQNQSSAKTDTLYINIHRASKSSAGLASTAAQKDSISANSAKSQPVATSSVGVSSCKKENGSLPTNAECPDSSSKATSASKQEWSMSKTASMDLDQILFQMGRLKNPISNDLQEPSDRWLKRLRHDASDTHFPGYKRLKVGNGPSGGETSSLFSRALGCDRARTDQRMEHIKEDQLPDERRESRCNREGSHVPAKSFNSWIGRWCQGGTPILHEGAPDQARPATKSNLAPEELEDQFPSIAAMAMMGRVMNKLRPCELQRRGPSVVWNTEGF